MLKLRAESPEKVKTIKDVILEFDRAVDREKLRKELKGKTIVDMLLDIRERRGKMPFDEYIKSLKRIQNSP